MHRLWATGLYADVWVESATGGVRYHTVPRRRLLLGELRFEPPGEKRPLGLERDSPIDGQRAHQAAAALRQSLEANGSSDARVTAELVSAGWRDVDLVLKVERGARNRRRPARPTNGCAQPPYGDAAYRVGRIEFRGNHAVADGRLRRAMLLDEGGRFDYGRLSGSLARLNRMAVFEPVTGGDFEVVRRDGEPVVDITIRLREAKHGRWSLSGPAGPRRFCGPFQAAIAARIPGSLWYASFSATPLPVFAVTRPSGLTLSPQLGPGRMLYGYGTARARQAIRSALKLDAPVLCGAPRQRYRRVLRRLPL